VSFLSWPHQKPDAYCFDAALYFTRLPEMWAVRLRLRMRRRTPHLPRRLVLAQPFIDHLPQQIVVGPGQELDLGDPARAAPNARG
jgi:hypothetical protein